MRISAGRLTRRVTLLEPTHGTDAAGGPTLTYADAGGRWCQQIQYAPVAEEREAQRQTAARVRLLLRLDSLTMALTTDWRVRFEGEELQIAGLERAPEDGSLILSGEQPTG